MTNGDEDEKYYFTGCVRHMRLRHWLLTETPHLHPTDHFSLSLCNRWLTVFTQ